MRSLLDGPQDTTLFHVLGRELDFAAAHQRSVSLAFLDVDDLTGFNERHGWNVGTALLESIADILAALGPDVSAGSFGGDEFAVVLPGISRRHARARMRDVLTSITLIGVHGVTQGKRPYASVGGATWRPNWTSADLIRGAHDALVASKWAGGRRVTWACELPWCAVGGLIVLAIR